MTTLVRLAAIAAVLGTTITATAARQAQTSAPPPGTGLVLGRVVEAGTGKMLPGITVTINGQPLRATPAEPPSPPRRVVTDDQGRYVFRQLRPGRYTISAEMNGNGYSPNGFMVGGFGTPIGAFGAGGYGQQFFGGPLQPIDLAEGERMADAVIGLFRTAAVSGTVRDENGDPLVDAVIGAVRVSPSGEFLDGPTSKTDDRGRFRLGSLRPGRYVVYVPQTQVLMPASLAERIQSGSDAVAVGQSLGSTGTLGVSIVGIPVGQSLISAGPVALVTNSFAPRITNAATFAYQTTFYPAAVSPDVAGIVTVAGGEERDGVDVQLAPVRTAPVSGLLFDAGEPAAHYTVHLLPQGSYSASLFETASTSTDQQGRFAFPLVPIGQYTLASMRLPERAVPLPVGANPMPEHSVPHPGLPGTSVIQPIGVSEDGVANILLTMKSGITVKAQAEFAGAVMPEERLLRNLSVLARLARPVLRYQGMSSISAYGDGAGAFRLPGMVPGRYALQISSLAGWSLQSVTIGGVEIGDAPFDFTSDRSDVVFKFTDKPLVLSGSVRDGKGAPDPDAMVVMFPTDRVRWPDARVSVNSFRAQRPTKRGDFMVSGLFPGDYIAVAIRGADLATWPDAGLLNRLATMGTNVRVTPNGGATVSLATQVLR